LLVPTRTVSLRVSAPHAPLVIALNAISNPP
jgi:hypothetical protein